MNPSSLRAPLALLASLTTFLVFSYTPTLDLDSGTSRDLELDPPTYPARFFPDGRYLAIFRSRVAVSG